MSELKYPGDELEIFALARNWKHYQAELIRPHLGTRVLEVGAGLGSNTSVLCRGGEEKWVCLEPDPDMVRQLRHRSRTGDLPRCCEIVAGTVSSANLRERFDAILYLDVLEHIGDDAAELAHIPALLRPGGKLIILAPAHQWLFTPFDERIGHHRRYSRSRLQKAVPPQLSQKELKYLDCAGLLASMGNRLLLGKSKPTQKQILIWDRRMIPLSRWLDPLFLGNLGKSVFGVWSQSAMDADP